MSNAQAIYNYVLQATGDPERAREAAMMAVRQVPPTPGIMSRAQNDPFGSLGTQPELRRQDPSSVSPHASFVASLNPGMSFSDFNNPATNPNAPIVQFGQQALGMAPGYEVGAGVGQAATGDPVGGGVRAIFGMPFWPKIMKGKGAKPIEPEDYIDTSTGAFKPHPIGLTPEQKTKWLANQSRAKLDWDASNPRRDPIWKPNRERPSDPPAKGAEDIQGQPTEVRPEKNSVAPFNNSLKDRVKDGIEVLWQQGKIRKGSKIEFDDISWTLPENVNRKTVQKWLDSNINPHMAETGSARNWRLKKHSIKGIAGIGAAGAASFWGGESEY